MNEHERTGQQYEIVAVGDSEDGDMFLDVLLRLPGSQERRIVSARELQESPDRAINSLRAALITTSARSNFKREAERALQTMKPSFRVVTKTGWTGNVFVKSDGTCIPRLDNFHVCLPSDVLRYGPNFERRGTMEGWGRIPELARGNSRLLMAIALGFVGPLLELLGVEIPMVEIFGLPGSGKSCVGVAVGSIWGGAGDEPFGETWNNTVNNFEPIHAAYHGAVLVLDETKVADGSRSTKTEAVLDAVMRLSGGREKGRRTDSVPAPLGTAPVLSTSNLSLDEMCLRDRVPIDDAYRGRMIDVPLAFGVVGAFEDLHDFATHSEFSVELLRIARANHGRAGRRFVGALARDLESDRDEILGWLRSRRAGYISHVRAHVLASNRDLERIHQKFATIFAAGCLAIRYDILPWKRDELGRALVECEQAHVDHVAQFVSAVEPMATRPVRVIVDPLARLRAHVRDRRSKLVDLREGLLDPAGGRNHQACEGYINRGSDGRDEYLFSEPKFVEISGGGSASRALKRQLEEAGWLARDGRRPCTRRTIWTNGAREIVIAVRAAAFSS